MTLDEPDRIRLRHMIEATQTALEFSAGRRQTELFGQDAAVLRARAIEIVGEAASKVSPAGRASMPALPWKSMVGMRNKLIHAYFDIDATIVWTTVSEELPALLGVLQAIETE